MNFLRSPRDTFQGVLAEQLTAATTLREKVGGAMHTETKWIPVVFLAIGSAAPILNKISNWRFRHRHALQMENDAEQHIIKLQKKSDDALEQYLDSEEPAGDGGWDGDGDGPDWDSDATYDPDASWSVYSGEEGEGEDEETKLMVITLKLYSTPLKANAEQRATYEALPGIVVQNQRKYRSSLPPKMDVALLSKTSGTVTLSRAAFRSTVKAIKTFANAMRVVQECPHRPSLAIDLWNMGVTTVNETLGAVVANPNHSEFCDGTVLREALCDAEVATKVIPVAIQRDPRALKLNGKLRAKGAALLDSIEADTKGHVASACIRFMVRSLPARTFARVLSLKLGIILLSRIGSELAEGDQYGSSDMERYIADSKENIRMIEQGRFKEFAGKKLQTLLASRCWWFVFEMADSYITESAMQQVKSLSTAEVAFSLVSSDAIATSTGYRSDYSKTLDNLDNLDPWEPVSTTLKAVIDIPMELATLCTFPLQGFLSYWLDQASSKMWDWNSSMRQQSRGHDKYGVNRDKLRRAAAGGIPTADCLFDLSEERLKGKDINLDIVAPPILGDQEDTAAGSLAVMQAATSVVNKLESRKSPPSAGLCLLMSAAADVAASSPPKGRANALLSLARVAVWPGTPADVGSLLAPHAASVVRAVQASPALVDVAQEFVELKVSAGLLEEIRQITRPKSRSTKSATATSLTDSAQQGSTRSRSPTPPPSTTDTNARDGELVPWAGNQGINSITSNFQMYRSAGVEIDMAKSVLLRESNDEVERTFFGEARDGVATQFSNKTREINNKMKSWAFAAILEQTNEDGTAKIDRAKQQEIRDVVENFYDSCQVIASGSVRDGDYYPSYEYQNDDHAQHFDRVRQEREPNYTIRSLRQVMTSMASASSKAIDGTTELIAHPTSLAQQCFNDPLSIPNFSVEFQNVFFHYNPDKPVLRGVSFKIESGAFVGFVGASGCGKSTVFELIRRRSNPISGKILVNGRDIRDFPVRWLRRRIACVLQQGGELASSIHDHVLLGDPLAANEEGGDAVKRALELAEALDFVQERPMGTHTSTGASFSGGEWQRLDIAQALVKKPERTRMFLFDEATSALDVETERKIQAAIEQRGQSTTGNRITVVAAAHRLSTLKNCDHLVVMEKGRVIESGKWNDLMAKDGVFAKFVETQDVRGEGMEIETSTDYTMSREGTYGSGGGMGDVSRSYDHSGGGGSSVPSPSRWADARQETPNDEHEGSNGGEDDEDGEECAEEEDEESFDDSDASGSDEEGNDSSTKSREKQEAATNDADNNNNSGASDDAKLAAVLDYEQVLLTLSEDAGTDLDKLDQLMDKVDTVKARFGLPSSHRSWSDRRGSGVPVTGSPTNLEANAVLPLDESTLHMLPIRVNLKRNDPKLPTPPFSSEFFTAFQSLLPAHMQRQKWVQAYSSDEVGFSLRTMRHELQLACEQPPNRTLVSVVLFIKPKGSAPMFGAFLPTIPDWENKRYTKNTETFLFRVASDPNSPAAQAEEETETAGNVWPTIDVMRPASAFNVEGANDYHYKAFAELGALSVGGGGKGPAIHLKEELDEVACSTECPTFVGPATVSSDTAEPFTGLLSPDTEMATTEIGVVHVPTDLVEVWAISENTFDT